jgi:hypothetical protein
MSNLNMSGVGNESPEEREAGETINRLSWEGLEGKQIVILGDTTVSKIGRDLQRKLDLGGIKAWFHDYDKTSDLKNQRRQLREKLKEANLVLVIASQNVYRGAQWLDKAKGILEESVEGAIDPNKLKLLKLRHTAAIKQHFAGIEMHVIDATEGDVIKLPAGPSREQLRILELEKENAALRLENEQLRQALSAFENVNPS